MSKEVRKYGILCEEEVQLLNRRKKGSHVVPERFGLPKGRGLKDRYQAKAAATTRLRYESTSTIDPVQDTFDTSPASLHPRPPYWPIWLSWLQCRTSAVSGVWCFGRKAVKRAGLGGKGNGLVLDRRESSLLVEISGRSYA